MASPGSPLIPAVVALVAGAALLAYGFRELRRKRLLEDTPTSKVRSMAVGLVELHARAFVGGGAPLEAPFSGQPCCWYEYKVEEYRRQGKSSHWVTLLRGSAPSAVWVGDDTGQALVDLAGAEVDVPVTFQSESGLGRSPPPRVQQFLAANHAAWQGFVFNKTMRYTEHAMQPGHDLYVMGTAAPAPAPPAGGPPTARTDVVLRKGREGVLLLSTKSEAQLDRRYGGLAAGCVALGGLLVVGVLAWLLEGVL